MAYSWLDSQTVSGAQLNKRELSEYLALSERTLTEWMNEGMPVCELGGPGHENRYDLGAVARWACLREVQKRNIVSPFDRLNLVRAQREELSLARDKGEIVSVEEMRPAVRRWVNEILGVLLSIPDRYAQQLEQVEGIPAKVQVLNDLIAELRDVMGNYEPCRQTDPAGNPPTTQSAENHAR